MLRTLIYVTLLPLAAMAQAVPEGVKYDLTGLAYSRVGLLARVQGVVRLELIPTEVSQEVKFVSGPALLVREASENLAKWRTDQPVSVNYVFRLTDPELAKVRVPKSNGVGRLFLRMFHLTTYTEEPRCQQTSSTDFSPKVSEPRLVQRSPLVIEVQVTALTSCLVTVSSGLIASR